MCDGVNGSGSVTSAERYRKSRKFDMEFNLPVDDFFSKIAKLKSAKYLDDVDK